MSQAAALPTRHPADTEVAEYGPNPGNLMFVDFETNGLLTMDHFTPLEVSVIITDARLRVVEEVGPLLFQTTQTQLEAMDEVVRQMHTKTGLLEKLQTHGEAVEQVDQALSDLAARHFPARGQWLNQAGGPYKAGDRYRGIMMAGQSVGGFDRIVVARFLPKLHAMMDYRVLDVSGMRHMAESLHPDVDLSEQIEARYTHSSLDDVRYSVELARACLKVLGSDLG